MGDGRERELSNTLEDDHGWGVVRPGGSGSGTDRARPDLLAGDAGRRYWAIEEKYRAEDKQCYESPEKHRRLSEFATRFGARPVYAVRYSTRLDDVTTADWFIVPFDAVSFTDGGNVRLNHAAVSECMTLTELLASRKAAD